MLVWGMLVFGVTTLLAGLFLVSPRMRPVSGVRKILPLGPVFEATALAMFAAEHFFAAEDDSSTDDCIRRKQPQHTQRQSGFSTTGFPNHAY